MSVTVLGAKNVIEKKISVVPGSWGLDSSRCDKYFLLFFYLVKIWGRGKRECKDPEEGMDWEHLKNRKASMGGPRLESL